MQREVASLVLRLLKRRFGALDQNQQERIERTPTNCKQYSWGLFR
ncbi:MAG: DUF4351 domain-containing protein [Calothrix sp. C42_A2020_038]|nr:DUF4351 domain-containing protein [Calothrix sp. C42_A2020_038]